MTDELPKGWFLRQVQEAKKSYDEMPEWMKVPHTRQAPEETEVPSNHYDKDGYCDNPARGY